MTAHPRLNRCALLCLCFTLAPLNLPTLKAEAVPVGTPFQAASAQAAKTRFTTLPATETGISAPNLYNDPRMWWENYREFSLGAIGTGVAIGDYDNDGKPDVYVVCKVGENHLFHNEGNFRFTDVTARAGVAGPVGAWKQGVSWADVNNDGKLDLYVCRFNAPNLLFINQGDGTFKEEADAWEVAVSDASNQAAFCDYDRDGKLDFYLQTNVLDCEAHPNGQRDYLFHNNGDGTFSNVTDAAGIFGETQGHSATWWDYNEDGWPDLYVANDFKDPDQLYRNNGDGTFTNTLSRVVPHTPDSSMGADFGDVNNDGHIDLLVADMSPTTRFKDQLGMAKLRAGLPFNDTTPRSAPQYMRNALYLNTGMGRMLEGANLAGLSSTDWTWTVRFEDLDNDGRLDAFFTNGTVRAFNYVDMLRKTNACESDAERIRLIKASPPLAENNLAFKNVGDLEFHNVAKEWGLDHLGVSFGTAFGDLDGDGDLDLVFASYDGEVTVCRNDSEAAHRIIFDLRGKASNRFGIGSKVTIETTRGIQTRALVLARGYLSTSDPSLHFGLGDETSVANVRVEWPSGFVQTLGPLKADSRYTIEEPEGTPRKSPATTDEDGQPGLFEDVTQATRFKYTSTESPLSELKDQPLLTLRQNRLGPALAVADLDLDGEDDILVGGTAAARARIFSNVGQGHFLGAGSEILNTLPETTDAGFLVFDANGDGYPDLLSVKGGNQPGADLAAYQPHLLLGDGKGRFQNAPVDALPQKPVSAGSASAADFNRDGKLDVFIGGRQVPGHYPDAPESQLLENRGGTFADVTDALAPGLRHAGRVTSSLWSDVDGDGWLDLILTLDFGTPRYWHNLQGRGFEDLSETSGIARAGSGWWNSVASADFNGDGRPDFALGNVGLNTLYKATATQPFSLYAGAFDAPDKPLLIEAQYENDILYPVRGPQVLSNFLPWLNKRFPTFESYAKADLTKVFGTERLAKATHLTATEFRSGCLLSGPDGTYHFAPFPRVAQIAPIYGTVAADFNGDGATDLLAVQNSFAPIGEVGRFDGGLGLLLAGDGKGGFRAVSPEESHWLITGDGKGLATLDIDHDGWPDLAVTRSNDETQAWHNRGTPGHHSFAIALRGKPGNTTAIGARVAVTLKDGRTQALELSAGSGYHSQSTAHLFFGFQEGNLPALISVRWPDGTASTHHWDGTPLQTLVQATAP